MSNVAILVTGSRCVSYIPWHLLVWNVLDERTKEADRIIVIHGLCPNPTVIDGRHVVSIDMEAHRWAHRHDTIVMPFPANWKLGRKGGPVRNKLMVDTILGLNASGVWKCGVLAFHPNIRDSAGTRHTIEYARDNGCPVSLYNGETYNILPAR
jgi:hypothetical protein